MDSTLHHERNEKNPRDNKRWPLSSEHGTYTTVKAKLWPWIFLVNVIQNFQVVPSWLGRGSIQVGANGQAHHTQKGGAFRLSCGYWQRKRRVRIRPWMGPRERWRGRERRGAHLQVEEQGARLLWVMRDHSWSHFVGIYRQKSSNLHQLTCDSGLKGLVWACRWRRKATTSPQGGIKSPFPDPRFVQALAGSRRRVLLIKAIGKDDLIPLRGLVAPPGNGERRTPPRDRAGPFLELVCGRLPSYTSILGDL